MITELEYMDMAAIELRVAAFHAAESRLNAEHNVLMGPTQLRGWTVAMLENAKPGTLRLNLTRHEGNHYETKVAYCSPELLSLAQLLGIVERTPSVPF